MRSSAIHALTRTLVLLVFLCSASATRSAAPEQIKKIAEHMVCLCGDCNRESLATCLCGFASTQRENVGAALDAGRSQDLIIEQFVKQFGPVVLATPPAEGSNLLVWIAPAALMLFGIVLMRSVLLRWRGRSVIERQPRPSDEGSEQATPQRFGDQLQRELDQFDTE